MSPSSPNLIVPNRVPVHQLCTIRPPEIRMWTVRPSAQRESKQALRISATIRLSLRSVITFMSSEAFHCFARTLSRREVVAVAKALMNDSAASHSSCELSASSYSEEIMRFVRCGRDPGDASVRVKRADDFFGVAMLMNTNPQQDECRCYQRK